MTNKEDRYNEYFMDSAHRVARMSYAEKLKVGSVAVRDNHKILDGFNGMPPGMDNLCENLIDGNLVTKDDVMHAEENLILYAAKKGIPLAGAELYCTHSPCIHCARMIYGAGITKVYYSTVYRSDAGLVFLQARKVKLINLVKPSLNATSTW